ncbi:hypothetical protein [Nocardiopsis ansamitocini]|uniref:Uncharacterized protein n=1 Tax=Nocardiopsis ansamitocini TaxID=1670832 RepID=A0A9W6UIM7_9ACTN|nr:hypothetical protein [Nocardiopsis ansamitocini]GLU47598.1 hypothetical protein Nans01_19490 [Nocardiopsis ansamitocini]
MRREEREPLFDVMDAVARARRGTVAQVALNRLIAVGPLVVPIPGAKSPPQAKSNAAALDWSLTVREFALLSRTEEGIRHSPGR